ncbi:MAG: bifunctional methylenetetrahydrofolate dehydrogenase/methenyltetrahydrofolate cyclohydrolase FolD [Proteobacteria bacterium]|nr:bifunctional methylenetetrahydrofolate dehydrogenase/methenyltetrahydrofolate cyclohydrolase FolD [Pseudomonadota bacterium]
MILDGKALAKRLSVSLREETAAFTAKHGLAPCLATVLVGDDPASAVYVKAKRKACARNGFISKHIELPASTTQDELLALVHELNDDAAVHGILVQLPLPDQISDRVIIDAMDPAKDVDGFHPESIGALVLKRHCFVPCTPKGVMKLIEESGIDCSGKQAVVVGRSPNVGLPAALLLMQANATVTIVHSRTPEDVKKAVIGAADILVVAVGRPHFVKGAWIKEGAVVIDVGINRLDDGRLVGDVEYDTAAERASAITPVPGGVGPMTISQLMANTLQAARDAVAP